jgi:phosphohistidine phosphatase SixA
LLVGHNPDFENLLQVLLGAADLPDTLHNGIATATLIRLAMPNTWPRYATSEAALLSVYHGNTHC